MTSLEQRLVSMNFLTVNQIHNGSDVHYVLYIITSKVHQGSDNVSTGDRKLINILVALFSIQLFFSMNHDKFRDPRITLRDNLKQRIFSREQKRDPRMGRKWHWYCIIQFSKHVECNNKGKHGFNPQIMKNMEQTKQQLKLLALPQPMKKHHQESKQ